tara:strand:- start:654 stop:875 length:222 start_codon:yes stop_codon:yes gene_type:complete
VIDMIITDEQIFKMLMLIQDISSMKDSAKMQTRDLVDIINENFSVETSEKIIHKLMTDGLLDKINIKVADIFG